MFVLEKQLDGVIIKEEVQSLLQHIRPTWEPTKVHIEVMEGGVINKMWKCFQEGDTNDNILIKIFGATTGQFLDRALEFKVMEVLNDDGIVSPIFCRFKNGYAYKFEPGDLLTPAHFLDPHIYKKIIRKFHEIHGTDLRSRIGTSAPPYTNIAKAISDNFKRKENDYLDQSERYRAFLPARKEYMKELELADKFLEELENEFPVVVTHTDAHSLNIIYNSDSDKIIFLDWELIGTNPEVLDIAIHWYRDVLRDRKAASIDMCENNDYKHKWMLEYLSTHAKYQHQGITEELLQQWLNGVNKACYAMNAFCVAWAVCQTSGQTDYMQFAQDEYTTMKRLFKKFGHEWVKP